ncbi:MAG: dipicolinate synthase subunit DpsA [Ruminococcaceae bacterium]|nr:dipicolinate synthase subunit DpsA [Oscillospiraceae bacterium]
MTTYHDIEIGICILQVRYMKCSKQEVGMYIEFMKDCIFAVVGGDLRQARLANALAVSGYTVYGLFFDLDVYVSDKIIRSENIREALEKSNVIVLPLPASLDDKTVNSMLSTREIPLDDCLRYAKPGSILVGGMLSKEFRERAEERGITTEDYAKREEFAVLNAVPTAEGAVAIAMAERAATIRGSKCLVTGYGKVGKRLAALLCAMGANVSVAARKPKDLAEIEANGMSAMHISGLSGGAGDFEVLFNTVPAMIFGEDILRALRRDCLVLDLASKPGGVDFEMAKRLGIHTIWALSLPGKVAPITAGDIMRDTILNILRERRSMQ